MPDSMRTTTLLLLGVMFATVACAEDDTSADTASGGSGGSSGGTAGAPATSEDFGASCTAHADCHGDTTYCAMPPGAPAYCTATGCDAEPDLCPAMWICFDVSQFVAGEPWICAPPN